MTPHSVHLVLAWLFDLSAKLAEERIHVYTSFDNTLIDVRVGAFTQYVYTPGPNAQWPDKPGVPRAALKDHSESKRYSAEFLGAFREGTNAIAHIEHAIDGIVAKLPPLAERAPLVPR